MDAKTYHRNKVWLAERAGQYPFRCRTKVRSPTPAQVASRLHPIDFIAAPLMKETEWGFKTAEEMRRFKSVYTTLDNKT